MRHARYTKEREREGEGGGTKRIEKERKENHRVKNMIDVLGTDCFFPHFSKHRRLTERINV
jgi:hypothetical protein